MTYKSVFFLVLSMFTSSVFAQADKTNIQKINCTVKFPQRETHLKQMQFIRQFTRYATHLAFVIHDEHNDAASEIKKACFTKSGWRQYKLALLQSGNLNAIKQDRLQTSMILAGGIKIKTDNKHHLWRLHIPIQLAYQNSTKRIKQNLDVLMLLTLNTDGRLAVMQVIGRPKS